MTSAGIVSVPSRSNVDATVEKLKTIVASKGITIFALIDHSGEAEKAGFEMRNTKLLIFGNPKSGTPLMLAAPTSALDLPLKVLVWEDAQGRTWLSYNSVDYFSERHGISPGLTQNIAGIEVLVAKAAE